ncbi:hypothetical protein LOTGIDRAFT_158736 [Lottia gigantea]|uniref:Uncharacterized protein n=1 Tax=Lottia gigantea TaxID=225164 RepID=V4AUY9_LOTGI|nr:hypothetical protein LOTGIDRAFT_158736 [Lottia gigantea]ESO98790.1 hypothetical protein LOTGIDRAFT_158736 [Lottia gigantea]
MPSKKRYRKKKYDSCRHKRKLFPDNFGILPSIVERSHENSPVTSLTSPKGSTLGSPIVSWPSSLPLALPPKIKPEPSASKTTSNVFDDSGFEVTPPKVEGNSATFKNKDEMMNYLKKLEENNKNLQEENKSLHTEMNYKIKYLADLQTQYEGCIDSIVEIKSKINNLENGCIQNPSHVSLQVLQAKKKEIVELKYERKNIIKEHEMWRERSYCFDADNDSLKEEIGELKNTIKELIKENGRQRQPQNNLNVPPKQCTPVNKSVVPKQSTLKLGTFDSKLVKPVIKINSSDLSIPKTSKEKKQTYLPPIDTSVGRHRYPPTNHDPSFSSKHNHHTSSTSSHTHPTSYTNNKKHSSSSKHHHSSSSASASDKTLSSASSSKNHHHHTLSASHIIHPKHHQSAPCPNQLNSTFSHQHPHRQTSSTNSVSYQSTPSTNHYNSSSSKHYNLRHTYSTQSTSNQATPFSNQLNSTSSVKHSQNRHTSSTQSTSHQSTPSNNQLSSSVKHHQYRHTSSTHSTSLINNQSTLPTNQIKLPHIPTPPTNPKTHQTRKYKR